MIVFGAAFTGAIFGGVTAKRRGGKGADIAQYAAIFGIMAMVAGLLTTIAIHRLLV